MTTETGRETVTPLEAFQLPWNKQMQVDSVTFDTGVRLLRLRFREGKRFTIVDLDADTASRLADMLRAWCEAEEPA